MVWTFATGEFKPCFEVFKLVSVLPKNIKLGQMTNLGVIFHVHLSPSENLKFTSVSYEPQPGEREDETPWERSCHGV